MTIGGRPRTAFPRSTYPGTSNRDAQVPQSNAARDLQWWPTGRDFR
jgi:hypothetical protein